MRERLKKLGIYSIALCAIYSCGKSIESHDASKVSNSPAKYTQDDFSVDCHAGNSGCPDYIAYVKNEESSCNAVLVKEGLLVTSRHCFSEHNPATLCESLDIMFPETQSFKFQQLNCHDLTFSKSIGDVPADIESHASNQKRLSPVDVIYIQISTTGRSPVAIKSSFNLGQSLRIKSYSFDTAYDSELFLHERECFVSQKSYASPLYGIDSSAPAALTNCLGKPEELGAPILNDSGELVAISGSFFREDDAQGLFKVTNRDTDKLLRSVFIAQKAACMDFNNQSIQDSCQGVLSIDKMNARVSQLFLESADQDRIIDFESYLTEKSSIQWKRIYPNLNVHWGSHEAFQVYHEPICKTSEQLPNMIPSYKPRLKIKHGWRLGLGYTLQEKELDYGPQEIGLCR